MAKAVIGNTAYSDARDRTLLKACALFAELQQKIVALDYSYECGSQAERAHMVRFCRWSDWQDRAARRVASARASSMAGHRARAALLMHSAGNWMDWPGQQQIAAALVRDLAAAA